jgi:hypothetical protein
VYFQRKSAVFGECDSDGAVRLDHDADTTWPSRPRRRAAIEREPFPSPSDEIATADPKPRSGLGVAVSVKDGRSAG